jgi:hypothetical protein
MSGMVLCLARSGESDILELNGKALCSYLAGKGIRSYLAGKHCV